ncbi:MAG: hypothetical protein OEZ38_13395 [Gammaproteobacteria bacterium]|nr:hypothetical protein [Gammaproteobacteria bacterium]
MIRVAILILLVLIGIVLFAYLSKTQRNKRDKIVKIILFIILACVLLLLVITGKLNWLIALLGSLAAFIPKILKWVISNMSIIKSLISKLNSQKSSSESVFHGHRSSVKTRFIVMELDHDAASMDGDVIDGEFAGRKLSEMTIDEIDLLINGCEDNETISLLMAYKDHYYRSRKNRGHIGESLDVAKPEFMSIHEARKILSVDIEASEDEVMAAFEAQRNGMVEESVDYDRKLQKLVQAKNILISSLANK